MPSVFRATYKRTDPKTGKVVRRKYRKHTIKYKDASGDYVTVPGLRDKEASWSLARKLQNRADRERAGIRDPFEEHERTELGEHLKAFEAHLAAKDDTADHVDRTIRMCKAIVEACDFVRAADISGSAVSEYLAGRRRKKDFGKQTSNYYLTAIKSFCRWLVKDRRAASNPLAHLSILNTEGECSRVRRVVTAKEFSAVIVAANTGGQTHRIPGPDRAVLYILAAYTGFRARELASMTSESFDLQAKSVTVEAAYSKRRRVDAQPLRSDLAELIGDWLKGRQGPLWPGKWYRRAAEMLRVDLKAADVPYHSNGRTMDFHALRHSYITLLHRGGTYGKVLQSLARHSTPMLTARYTHVDLNDVDSALAGLPGLPITGELEPKQKTG